MAPYFVARIEIIEIGTPARASINGFLRHHSNKNWPFI